ncbi:MAG: putative extracellular solute-binding protein family 3 [Capsulimonas sp.]|jgi:polar amino acid transport system substrate-binding protein|nr:putative extracellular solute-binding protein family 3 [Capsulimonas sp.]
MNRWMMFLVGVGVFTTLGVAAAAQQAPPPGASARVDAIRRRGKLRVAVLNEYPWLKETTRKGRPFEGPAWRLAEEYARQLGVTLETVPVDFDTKISVLASGQADITIAPLLATPERAKSVDLILYSVSAQCLFGRADNPKVARAAGVDDLNRPEITIAYIAGSPQGTWLQKRLPRAVRRPIPGTLADVPVDEIVSRRADVTTIDKFFFTGLAQKTPGLIALPKDYMASRELPIPIGMAISKGQPAFLKWLRAVAKAVHSEVAAEEARLEKAGSGF